MWFSGGLRCFGQRDDSRFIRAGSVDLLSSLAPSTTDVVQALARGAREIGYPQRISLDNGPELMSNEHDLWAFTHGLRLGFSHPGTPTDNA